MRDIEADCIEVGRGGLLREAKGVPDIPHQFPNPFPRFLYTSGKENESDALQGCHPGTGHLAMSYLFYGVLLHLGSLLDCFLAGLLNVERYWPLDRDVDG